MKVTHWLMRLGTYENGFYTKKEHHLSAKLTFCLFRRHWLGLPHTFDNGCTPGDYIADTAAEKDSYSGCDVANTPDTCPTDPGLDPIHNFMDYSDDICLYKWTPGQIDVMHANIEFYRSGITADFNPVQLTTGVLSDKYTMPDGLGRQFYMDVPASATITCTTTAVSGDVNLFVNWDGNDKTFECKSESEGSSAETCTVGPNSGRVYAWVYSSASTIDFQIRCGTAS